MREDDLLSAFADAGLARSGDALWLDASEVVGGLPTEAGAFIGWVDVAWDGPATPVRQLRDVVHVPYELVTRLVEAVAFVRARREAAMRTCRYCGDRNTPGAMHADDVCHGCAERHLGVVH